MRAGAQIPRALTSAVANAQGPHQLVLVVEFESHPGTARGDAAAAASAERHRDHAVDVEQQDGHADTHGQSRQHRRHQDLRGAITVN